MTVRVRIGTRGSPLALAQAEAMRADLAASHADLADPEAIVIVPIRTTGDAVRDRPLAAVGGKGLFVKEIEHALLDGHIDVAVHSMKDVPTWLPDGLEIACVPTRADPRDALIANGKVRTLDALPEGAMVGTSSPRRQAQLLAARPDLRVVPCRGNVGTRLGRVADGHMTATVLAMAGLHRLSRLGDMVAPLSPGVMLPAVGQGALAYETRVGDLEMQALLAPLSCPHATRAAVAERSMLEVLDGSCYTPIGGLADSLPGGRLRLSGLVAMPDGRRVCVDSSEGYDPVMLGQEVGGRLRSRMGRDLEALWAAG